METGEQREAAKLENACGRERLLGWKRLEGRARLLGWRRLIQGEAGKLVEAVDGKTLHLLGMEVSLLLGPDTTFIGKGSVLAIRNRHSIH